MKELQKILDSNEEVFWEGKPKFLPFFFSGLAGSLFGLVFLFGGALVLFEGIRTSNALLVLFPHFWVGVAFVFGVPLYKALVYKHTYYAITNKRVLLQTGLIGRDFEIVDFDQVTNAEVNVGAVDTLLGNGSGSILLFTAGSLTYTRQGPVQKPYTLSNIDNPYGVFKFFKKASHVVKTDIQFPNKLRPKKYPDHGAKYKPPKLEE